jgi:glycosyltransferase involved in cell wall biosynthesis
MKIAAYIHLRRTRTPTGVGMHIIHMVRGLASSPQMQVQVLAPRADLDSAGQIPGDTPLAGLPTVPLPLGRRFLEGMWRGLDWPAVDRWSGDADWIYCPAEVFVATRKAALAVTVHDTHALELDLPWSGTPQHKRLRRRWLIMFKQIRRHARLILAVSQFTKDRLVSLLDIDPKKIAVVGNGVEEIYFADSADNEAAGQDLPPNPYLYIVGGLSQKKGAVYLLAVARKLSEAAPHIRVVVAGIAEQPFKEQASEMGNVIVLGYVPAPRQARLMRGALAVMMLSRFEGFGVPALEAMAVGTPAIVSSFASLPEVVGDAGLIANAEDPDAVMQSILRVEGDGKFREALIARGRRRAGEFHWSAAVAKLIAALKSAS